MDAAALARKNRRSIACDECKRRKVRCSADAVCKNCTRNKKACVYSSLWHRVTALQRTVDHYEGLLESIRDVWATHVSGVTLDNALAAAHETPMDSRNFLLSQCEETGWPRASLSSLPPVQSTEEVSASSDVETPEDNNAEDFEFDESQYPESVIDGMGFLAVEAGKSGYIGPLSRKVALEVLQSLPSGLANQDAARGVLVSNSNSSFHSYDHALIDAFINAYFLHYHPCYPLLHEGLFRARLAGAVSKPRDGSWPLLVNMVAAIGAFAGDSGASNIHENYYNVARDSISLSVIEKGSLCYVQGLTLMANYLQKIDKPNAGFALIGVAWSMAMAIGLHREFGTFYTTPYTMELRRRTWWTLFVCVSGAQLTMGRPPASLIGVNLHPPVNLNDSNLSVDMFDLPEPQDGPTVASCLIAQIKLTQIANSIQAEILTSQVPAQSRVDTLRQQITMWRTSLPSCFAVHGQNASWFEMPKRVLLWRSLHLQILLNRPFLFRAIGEKRQLATCEGSVQECINAADECIASICQTLEEKPDCRRGYSWYATYWLVSASFVHATCYAYTSARNVRKRWETRIDEVIRTLQHLKNAHIVAGRAQRVLEKLLETRNSDGVATPLTVENGQAAWETFLGAENNLANLSANYFALGDADFLNLHNPLSDPSAANSGGDILWMYAESSNTRTAVSESDMPFQY